MLELGGGWTENSVVQTDLDLVIFLFSFPSTWNYRLLAYFGNNVLWNTVFNFDKCEYLFIMTLAIKTTISSSDGSETFTKNQLTIDT